MMKSPVKPEVSVIIIHYGSTTYLESCMNSLKTQSFQDMEIIVVDNNREPSNEATLMDIFGCKPALKAGSDSNTLYLKTERNLGFAGGCNLGIISARGRYIFILNNDIELQRDCLGLLVDIARKDDSIGFMQPKMLDFIERDSFHSSAAGGMIDMLGYPFARGRILGSVEKDYEQYNDSIEIFWASGTAFFASREAVVKAGMFDEDFFLYMEEIDLCWRMRLLGFKGVYIPESVVYHIGAPNLGRETFMRMYYCHRNSLLMLIKNLSVPYLLCLFPLRVGLEFATLGGSILTFRRGRAGAIFKSFMYLILNMKKISAGRKEVQKKRVISDKKLFSLVYKGSVGLQYAMGHKKASSLRNITFRKYHST